jgi:hypothetical protein
MSYRASGKVGLAAVPLWLIGIAACGAIGALYRWVVILNPWGIANPILTVIVAFGLGFVSIQCVRLGKARSTLGAFIAAMLMFLAFQAAGLAVIHHMTPAGSPVSGWWEALRDRWSRGVPVLGGHWSMRGWWMWPIAGLEWVLFFCAAQFTSTVESGRPFCESCKSWARKGRWRCNIANPSPAAVERLRSEKGLEAAIAIRPGGGSGKMEHRIGACRCGRMATLTVDFIPVKDGEDGTKTQLLSDLLLTPMTLRRVVEWGEGINPSLSASRPTLTVSSGRSAEPLGREPRPDGDEYRAFYRWDRGSVGASDAEANNEYTKELRARLKQGDWHVAEEALKAQRRADDLGHVAEACADWDERPAWVDEWADARPDSSGPLLVEGIWTVKWAWRARGVSWVPKDPGLFVSRMEQADELLRRACEISPKDPTPWAWRLICTFAFQPPIEEVQAVFDNVIARAPRHRMAHTWMMMRTMTKWGGSNEQMFAFARAALARSGGVSHLPVLIAEAHLERAYELGRDEGKAAMRTYFQQPAVGAEILKAHHQLGLADSVRQSMEMPRTRAMFAFVLWKSGQREAAADHLRVIGKSTPWGPFVPNVPFFRDTVRRARRECSVS